MNKQPERSVEEIVEELIRNKIIFVANSEQGEAYSEESVREVLTQTLQAERQKREEMEEAERKRIIKIIKEKGSYLDSQFQWKKELLQALTHPNNPK